MLIVSLFSFLCNIFRTERFLALKFTLRTAQHAIVSGAFGDGYCYLDACMSMAMSRPELRAMQILANLATSNMVPKRGFIMRMTLRKSTLDPTTAILLAKFVKLTGDIESALAKLLKKAPGSINNNNSYYNNNSNNSNNINITGSGNYNCNTANDDVEDDNNKTNAILGHGDVHEKISRRGLRSGNSNSLYTIHNNYCVIS